MDIYFYGGTKMYNKVSTNLNFVEREKEVLEFWKNNDIFKKTFTRKRRTAPSGHFMTARQRQTADLTSAML